MGPAEEPAPSRATSLIPPLAVALIVYVLGSWVRLLALGAETIVDKDWVGFARAGFLLARGRLDQLYAGAALSPQPFVHPPFFVWLCAPLAWSSTPWPPFLALTLASLIATAGLVLCAARIFAAPRQALAAAALLLLASAPWLACVMTGQLSVLLCLLVLASLWAWQSGRPLAAGLLLSLLAIKPNLLIPLVALLAIRRGGRVLLGVAAGVAALVLVSLPLGAQLWRDYFEVSRRVGGLAFDGSLAPWRQQTLLAFWSWALGDAALVRLAWLASAALAAVAVLAPWRPTPPAPNLRRLYGQAILFVVAVNPYLFFYDGLLLAVPALVWFLDRDGFTSRALWRACGLVLAAIFLWQHVAAFAHYDGCPPLVGPLSLLWLALDVGDQWLSCR